MTIDRVCRRMFGYSSVKRKPLCLATKGAAAAGARNTTALGRLHCLCNVPGPKVGCVSRTVLLKRRRMELTSILQGKEATGGSTKAAPQTVTPFVTD